MQYALLHNILYLGGRKYFRNQNGKYTLAEYNNGFILAKYSYQKDNSTLICKKQVVRVLKLVINNQFYL